MQSNGRWAGPGCGAKHVRAITAGHVERARAVAQRADTAASLTSAQRIQEDSLVPSLATPPPRLLLRCPAVLLLTCHRRPLYCRSALQTKHRSVPPGPLLAAPSQPA